MENVGAARVVFRTVHAFSLKTDSTLVERWAALQMHRDGTMEKIKARYL